jgi:hypothetical protein
MSMPWKNIVNSNMIRNMEAGGNMTRSNSSSFVRREWRHFCPKEKIFILKAISTCSTAKDLENVMDNYDNLAGYMADDWDFLASCLAACVDSKVSLNSKFEAVLKYAVQNAVTAPAWHETVFEQLFAIAVDKEASDILKDLLELAYDGKEDEFQPFITLKPIPNSKIMVQACATNVYMLVKALVDRGYRLKAFEKENKTRNEKENKGTTQQALHLTLNYGRECLYNDEIRNLRLLGLISKPSYVIACYVSMTEKCEWSDNPDLCECHPEAVSYPNFAKIIEIKAEGFHYCPTHQKFDADMLCTRHLECNDPITRCFILSKFCSDRASASPEHRAEYREIGNSCEQFAAQILDHCDEGDEVRMLLKEEPGANKYFKYIQHIIYPQLTLAVEHRHKEFVSHAYCQQVVMGDFYGNTGWKERGFAYKCVYALCQTILTPVHVIINQVFRGPRYYLKYKYGSSDRLNDIDNKDISLIKRWIIKMDQTPVSMDVPLNRFISYTGWHAIFIFLLINLATMPVSVYGSGNITLNHVAIFIYSLGMMWLDLTFLLNGALKEFANFWRIFFMMCHIQLNIAFMLKMAVHFWYSSSSERDMMELVSHALYAVATINSIVGLLYWFQLSRTMGPIIINLSHVAYDIFTMVAIFFTVHQGFIFGLYFILFGSDDQFDPNGEKSTYSSLASSLFWSLLNPGPVEIEAPPGSIKLRLQIANFVFAMYQIVAVILLMNLLIASMNSTTQRLEEKKELYWKYSRTRVFVAFFDGRYCYPVPFNIFLVALIALVFPFIYIFDKLCLPDNCLKVTGMEEHRPMSPEQIERRHMYSDLMVKLIQRYLRRMKYGDAKEKDAVSVEDLEALKKVANENKMLLQEMLRKMT